jgi:predicted ABC-type ATPase
MSGELWFWLLAGSNGAGKSTYAPNLPVEEFINPDDIARQFRPDAPEEAALSAGREALRRITDSIGAKRASFAVETTLSGRFHLQAVRDAKLAGWNVGLVYVGVRSADLAIHRVEQRIISGGHSVPVEDVRRRYERSLENLAIVYQLSDLVLVFDNSSSKREMRRVLEVHSGEITFKDRKLPEWVKRSLGALIGSRQKSKKQD